MKKMRLAALLAISIMSMTVPAVPAFAMENDPAIIFEENDCTDATVMKSATERNEADDADSSGVETEDQTGEVTLESRFDIEGIDLDQLQIPGIDSKFITELLQDLDPETVEVLLRKPKLLAKFLPDLCVTVTDSSVTVEIADAKFEKAGTGDATESKQTGTVVTKGSDLNVRSGPGIDYSTISQLANGSEVEVLQEENGWYRIVFPADYAYICSQYVKLNEVKTEETKEGYSFNIDSETLAQFLSGFSGLFEEGKTQEPTAAPRSSISGLTPDGNLTLVDDIGPKTGEGQQFITLVTKAGNYFYLVIDRDEKGEETVHFMNLVDEQDLFSLMEDDQKTVIEDQKAAEQAALEAEAAKEAEEKAAEEEAKEKEAAEKDKKSGNIVLILIIPLVLAAAGGGWFYLQTKKKEETAKPDPDADYLDDDDDEEDYAAGETEESEKNKKTGPKGRYTCEDEILGNANEAETDSYGDDESGDM